MPTITFLPDQKSIDIRPAESILHASLRAGLLHAHACGGNAQCSTCRVWVLQGLEHCPPRNDKETRLADRLHFDPRLRLSCQTVVQGDVLLRRLVLDELDLELTNQLHQPVAGTVGEQKQVAVMFADIRGFTSFSEPLPPYDVVYVLDRFFHHMGQVIERHGGTIENTMGDGLMALFGGDTPEQAALQAIRAGLAMLDGIEDLKPYLNATYERSFEIGIGIHHGPAVVGTLGYGSSRRLTAIGDAVNFASRVESANKTAGTRLLISDAIHQLVADRVRVGQSVHVELKGKAGRHTLYEVEGLNESATGESATVARSEGGVTWTRMLAEPELPPDSRRLVRLGEQAVLLIRHRDRIFAVESRCPHMRLPLKRATVSDDFTLTCPWHHSAFDLHTGDMRAWAPWPALVGPALGAMRRRRDLRTWPARLSDGYVWVGVLTV